VRSTMTPGPRSRYLRFRCWHPEASKLRAHASPFLAMLCLVSGYCTLSVLLSCTRALQQVPCHDGLSTLGHCGLPLGVALCHFCCTLPDGAGWPGMLDLSILDASTKKRTDCSCTPSWSAPSVHLEHALTTRAYTPICALGAAWVPPDGPSWQIVAWRPLAPQAPTPVAPVGHPWATFGRTHGRFAGAITRGPMGGFGRPAAQRDA
jgi:hypothetical protein